MNFTEFITNSKSDMATTGTTYLDTVIFSVTVLVRDNMISLLPPGR